VAPLDPRRPRLADALPGLTAAAALATGVVNLVSALTPNVAWRGHLLLHALPVRAVPVFHAMAVPAAVALLVAGVYLRRRRRRAWQAAVGLLLALGVLNLLKGLDVEEAALSFAAAGLLWWARAAFCVAPRPIRVRAAVAAVLATAAGVGTAGALLVWLGSGRRAEPLAVLHESIDLFAWSHGTMTFHDELAFVPDALGLSTLAAIVVAAYLLFRPLRPSLHLPDRASRAAAAKLVQAHGSDTLAFFKLRRDLHYLFAPDGDGFLGYRVEGNVMLVAGDPVGPASALPALVRQATAYAELHGLRLAALGAGRELLPHWRSAGLRALYIGDEAVVETAAFSLEGRSIRKVRQAVTRVAAAGYTAELAAVDDLDAQTLAELDRVSTAWRAGVPERGFTMAMDSLGAASDSRVVIARDRDDAVRGFLHFVPSYGRPAVSLSMMRRERETPNGLTEFLIVQAIEELRARGVDEMSLNFAAFGRLVARPGLLAPLLRFGSRHFQIESLYRFNAKFSPRWEPRYLVFASVLGLPRTGLAALRAEGQLPF
jgi:lysyl-tRNA synthetase class 2